MARNKLAQLKIEINKYLGIPYFSNTNHKVLSSDNALVGKGTAKEIALKTIELANDQHISLINLTSNQIYNFQKKNHLGIDCSGLVFHLLNFLNPKIVDFLIGTDQKKGVRRVSANLLTSPPNAQLVDNLDDIRTGDLIRSDNGKHVMMIVQKDGDDITYVHSTEKSKPKGVKYGQLKLGELKKYDGVYRVKLPL